MQGFKRYCSFVILIFLLSGCVGVEKDKTSSKAKITIESYNMSEKESLLISKTGVGNIEFFKLNGTLSKDDDLQFSVEVYKKGKLKEELLKSWGAIEKNYQDSFISFGVSDSNRPLKLLSGIPSGIATTTYSSSMTSSSFSNLISENITLTKNKPVYLVAWLGTTKNELRTVGSKNGELPAGIEEAELAFLYKVLWTDKGTNEH
ncbi:hypothetical protein ACQKNX_23720 [Lysinibacillus sp. NPDC093712]|uniref:hypothetical protein n=1 Tax=Lysinibacillus sp. NPDC093712 TaxID=3390579 RepID=UPI003D042A79